MALPAPTVIAHAKDLLRRLAYASGALGLWHRLRNRDHLTVLMFHRVLPQGDPQWAWAEREFTFSAEGFERVLGFVKRHYHVVSLEQVAEARRGGRPLPSRPLLITFDDGWLDTLTHAQPALARHGLTGLMFLCTELIHSGAGPWWQARLVHWVERWTDAEASIAWVDAFGPSSPMPPGHGRRVVELTAWLGRQPAAQRERWLDAQAPAALDVAPMVRAAPQMLDGRTIHQLDPNVIALGAHGHSHVPLTLVADVDAELRLAHAELQSLSSGRPATLSFPHGLASAEVERAGREAGFELMFSSEAALASSRSLTAPLPRLHMPENGWTCRAGRVAADRLALFLFLRPRRQAGSMATTG